MLEIAAYAAAQLLDVASGYSLWSSSEPKEIEVIYVMTEFGPIVQIVKV